MLAKRVADALSVVAIGLAVLIVLTLGFTFYLSRLSASLPDLSIYPDGLPTPRTSIVYAADGSVLAEWHGQEDRTVVSLEAIPDYQRNAVIAAEDRRFYEHDGVDFMSLMRAAHVNVEAGEVEQGGSTITQQLVKILFTGRERSLARKFKEALVAYEIESKTDKNKVLEIYLNTVYFGRGAYGIEAAADKYFGKHASSLTLAESATLAGIIRSPSRYGAPGAEQSTLERRNVVLRQMREQGFISTVDERAARSEPLAFAPPHEAGQVAPYFVEYVKRDLVKRLGPQRVYEGGLRVFTSLEPDLQAIAEGSASLLSDPSDPEVALVALRHSDGRVLAMVGGRDFKSNQFNLAEQGRRQPGSAFKPFVLVAALEQGVRPDQVFEASPYSVRVTDGVWNVQNYENQVTAGAMTLQAATDYSVNAVFARLIMQIGPDKVVDVAKRMGIMTQVDPNPAIALGGLKKGVSPLEMASAFGTLANNGVRTVPTGVIRVLDDRGKTVYESDPQPSRAIDREVAVQASLMLHDVIERGTGAGAKIGPWAAGKTGTTQSYRDAWFVGWAGDVSTAVWVGNRTAQVPMENVHGIKVTGGSFPAQIWRGFMIEATKARGAPVTPAVTQSVPSGQVLCTICEDSMLLANKRCPRTVELNLEPALVPKTACTIH